MKNPKAFIPEVLVERFNKERLATGEAMKAALPLRDHAKINVGQMFTLSFLMLAFLHFAPTGLYTLELFNCMPVVQCCIRTTHSR